MAVYAEAALAATARGPYHRPAMLALVLSASVAFASEAASGAARGSDGGTLRIEARARRFAPGEPVRILVRSVQALRSVSTRFLDRKVFMAREPALPGGGGETWWGWAAIPLDRKPGEVAIAIAAETAEGGEHSARLPVRIERKRFPVQRLRLPERYVTPPPEEQKRIERERERLAAIYALRTPASAPSLPFLPPVPGEPSSPYGARRILNGKPRAPHPGLDLRAASGTPVRASGPGRVALADDLYFSGRTVILDHGAGLFTVYAHLSELSVREGDEVARGQLIGLSGATGRVTGPHLHWGARVGELPFDPSALLDPALFR